MAWDMTEPSLFIINFRLYLKKGWKEPMKVLKLLWRAAAIIFSFSLLFFGLQRLLMPKYVDSVLEGRLIGEYYENDHQNQVIFVGDCEVYENFSPITLWEEFGITSYIRGGPQQLIWQSYYLLEEMLQYETPDVVIFNVLSMKYGTPQSEPYNRLNLDGMKWSSSKWNAIQASMMSDEHMLTYLFPLFRYHDRFIELESHDFTSYFGTEILSHNGYLMQTGVKPVTTIPQGQILENYDFSDSSYEYLDKMRVLCEEHDVNLMLVKAPTIYPYWYPQWDEQMEEYAARHQLIYVNYLDIIDEVGIDFETDTYDAGLHLNVHGAEKLSLYLGNQLQEIYGLSDKRGDVALSALWKDKMDSYYFMKNNDV